MVAGVSMLSSQTIGAKCINSHLIKVLEGRSYASKGRPVGSRHCILGRISERDVLAQAYFEIKADGSVAEILTTDLKRL